VYICVSSNDYLSPDSISSLLYRSAAEASAFVWGTSRPLDTVRKEGVNSGGGRVASPPFEDDKHSRDMLVMLKLMNSLTIVAYYTVPHTQTVRMCVSRSLVIVCALSTAEHAVASSSQEKSILRAANAKLFDNSQNSRSPTARNSYGDREAVVGARLRNSNSSLIGVIGNMRKKRAFSNVSFEPPKGFSKILEKGSTIIKPIKGSGCNKHLFSALDRSKLIHVIAHPSVLLQAYEAIKSKPGGMTKGISSKTLDGISMNWILATSKQLLAGKYKFGVARRIMIPKCGKKNKKLDKRPLTISSPREKVVQKAIHLVLKELFEPIFLDTSHGFRPGRSCLTALKMIDQHFRNAKWIIEADLTKCFDRIPHNNLLAVLGQTIKCLKTLAQSGLKAGYLHVGKLISGELVPQGSILSPLLSNIYLHTLDVFMASKPVP
jgi:retron-type reverse transcriptase